MNVGDIDAYLHGPFRKMEGWCVPLLWQTIQPLAQAIEAELGNGPIAEIGVHHGKFFIGLMKTMNAVRNNYAIDVFEWQDLNVDGSGRGNRGVFERNLTLNGVDPAAVEIMQTDSLAIGDAALRDIENATGGFSLFSIDGCHTVEHTMNDIGLAFRLTSPSGVIFVDDYYNPSWPGVQEGLSRIYLNDSPSFIPLLFNCNKLFLCHTSHHADYLRLVECFVRENFGETSVKRVSRFGHKGLTIIPNWAATNYVHR